ncbi:MAG TPA: extracellular solute-binding protein, partial [bacterium]
MLRRFAPVGLILVLLLGSFGVGATATPPRQLNIGVVAGGEIRGLQAIAPTWDKATGVRLNLIVYPYASLYEKMVTAFQANAATFDVVMLDDPWMPKF